MGDVVVPEGASFKLPLPLLWQHRHDQPIGHVTHATVTKSGIKVKAQIAKDVLPRIEEAWALIKSGLVRGLSIGFRPTEDPEPIKGTFGMKFHAWEWLELSAVTIPANADASIASIKSVDAEHLPASGEASDYTLYKNGEKVAEFSNVRITPSGVSDTPRAAVKASPPKRHMKKTTAEQITEFETKRSAIEAQMSALMEKAADEGRTLDATEAEEYDGHGTEIESIDSHLKRLYALQKAQAVAAKPAAGSNQNATGAVRETPVITLSEQTPPGIAMARVAIAQASSFIRRNVSALDVAKAYWPSDSRVHQVLQQKESIVAGTSVHATNAGPLVDQTNVTGEFIEFLRPRTILGQFGQGSVPSLRRVPFNIRYVEQTSGGNGYWVGEGAGKPLTGYDFSASTLLYTKVAAIAVITQELARFSSPSAEMLVRDSLADSLRERLDKDFVDPGVAAVTNVSPASITNGLTPLSSAGTSADNIRTDVQNLLEEFIVDNLDPTSAVFIMPQTLALAASLMVNDFGTPEFPGLTMRGGFLAGIPVVTSQYCNDASGGAGNLVILLNANDVFLADDGAVTVDVSDQVSLQMSNTPTINSTTNPPVAASLVSMWQTNSIAIRAERFINWKKRRASAVAYMDDVNWGAVGSPPTP
jgi:HK97 family phage major capsid protein/HK97 family phage prohead protease